MVIRVEREVCHFFTQFAKNTRTGIQNCQILRVYALLLGSPKKHCPAKRLAPAGWRNKLPWMENSFLEESPLSCLRPETRHFPSEVQETILDCSHKSSSSPMFPHNGVLMAREAVVGLVSRTLMTSHTSFSARCLWRLWVHATCPGWSQLHNREQNSFIFKSLFNIQSTFEFLVQPLTCVPALCLACSSLFHYWVAHEVWYMTELKPKWISRFLCGTTVSWPVLSRMATIRSSVFGTLNVSRVYKYSPNPVYILILASFL